MLSVRDIDVAYGRAKVLHSISIQVRSGEMVFVAGRNGAGKTTLLKSIAGFIRPVEGSITFEDREIIGVPPEKVALMGIRYVFQDKRVFFPVDGKGKSRTCCLSGQREDRRCYYPGCKYLPEDREISLSQGRQPQRRPEADSIDWKSAHR